MSVTLREGMQDSKGPGPAAPGHTSCPFELGSAGGPRPDKAPPTQERGRGSDSFVPLLLFLVKWTQPQFWRPGEMVPLANSSPEKQKSGREPYWSLYFTGKIESRRLSDLLGSRAGIRTRISEIQLGVLPRIPPLFNFLTQIRSAYYVPRAVLVGTR